MKLQQLIKDFNDKHLGVAFHYPRKRVVSINGFMTFREADAIVYLTNRLYEANLKH